MLVRGNEVRNGLCHQLGDITVLFLFGKDEGRWRLMCVVRRFIPVPWDVLWDINIISPGSYLNFAYE